MYVAGMMLVTAAIELTLALFLAVQGKLPAPSTTFLGFYAVVDIALFTSGGWLVTRGFSRLRSGKPSVLAKASPSEPPAS